MADQLNPQNSFMDRLFLFWQAYDEEAKLLREVASRSHTNQGEHR